MHWDIPSHTFKCPCHGAVFNESGQAIAGPVNAPLTAVAFQIVDGMLKIT